MTSWWCELAAVDGEVRSGVAITAHEGRFTTVVPDTAPPADAQRLAGLTIPGLANTHSHAFQRALVGTTERAAPDRDDSFWTWRTEMYRLALTLSPEDVQAIAAMLYVEMLEAGMTAVGEFHYLHHDIDGTRYGERAHMSQRIAAAQVDLERGDGTFLFRQKQAPGAHHSGDPDTDRVWWMALS